MTTKNDENDDNSLKIYEQLENLGNEVEDLNATIEHTEDKDKDEQWRADLTSQMLALKDQLAEIKAEIPRGQSAEVLALQQQVADLTKTLTEGLATLTLNMSQREKAALPSQETPTETLLETEAPPQNEQQTKAPGRRKSWI